MRSHASKAVIQAWTIARPDDPTEAAVNAARFAVTDGLLGTRAVSEGAKDGQGADTVRVAGVYGPEPPGALLTAPTWTPTGWRRAAGRSWRLDLRTGMVLHDMDVDGRPVTTSRWSVAGEPGCQVHISPAGTEQEIGGQPNPIAFTGSDGRRAVVVVADDVVGDERIRLAASATGTETTDLTAMARARADRLLAMGPEGLRGHQELVWKKRWAESSVTIAGDPEDDRRTRYALYHLLALGDHDTELPLGARGLTGPAYAGHVFWDADVFVLPALATIVPTAARAMLEYRLRRLDAACRFATESGAVGARIPWESAAVGIDVTPRSGIGLDGREVPIRTGQMEQHITADVAWALATYRTWVGDDAVLADGGSTLAIAAARYLASLVELDAEGVGHIAGVIGPDEYHEGVDDNAFTNRMVIWALRSAVEIAESGNAPATALERENWMRTASSLADGFDAATGRHIQFKGYDQLEPLLAASVAPPPFAADLLLGRDRVRRSQLIKQADVLMTHHMIPEEMPDGSLLRDLAHYLPRTAHGSSLSPAIHAAVLAKAGRPDDALRWYRMALAMDLDDLTGTTAGGLHYATIGGVWQALLSGFIGMKATGRHLVVNPVLPTAWEGIEVRCRYRGSLLSITVTHQQFEVESSLPVAISVGDDPTVPEPSTRVVAVHSVDGWVRS